MTLRIVSACASRSGYTRTYEWSLHQNSVPASVRQLLVTFLQCLINTVSPSLYSLYLFQASAACTYICFLIPQSLPSQGTTCKAWPRVNSVAFPRFSLSSKPVKLSSSFPLNKSVGFFNTEQLIPNYAETLHLFLQQFLFVRSAYLPLFFVSVSLL